MRRRKRCKFKRTYSRACNIQKPQATSNKPSPRHSWVWTLASKVVWLLLLVTSGILRLEDATKDLGGLITLILRFLKR